ncbi:hypothetical protein, partial [Acidocella sp.]|uniref:hypothetical protein n=1 Tax=Acidocella sp. TaxID=50710 RepID=UPI0026100FA5
MSTFLLGIKRQFEVLNPCPNLFGFDSHAGGGTGLADYFREEVSAASKINKHRPLSSHGKPQPLPYQRRDEILARHGILPNSKRYGGNHARVNTCPFSLVPLVGRHVGDRAGDCCQPRSLNRPENIKPAFPFQGRGNRPI